MRAFLLGGMLAWGGGLVAAELTVESDGRMVLPKSGVSLEVRVATAVPIAAAAEERTLDAPGVLAPAAEWRTAAGVEVRLDACLIRQPVGLSELFFVIARLRFTNPTSDRQTAGLAFALRPVGELRALAFERHTFLIDDRPVLIADSPSRGGIMADSAFAERPLTPQHSAHVVSATGECRGEMLYDVALDPGATQTLAWLCPLEGGVDLETCRMLASQAAELFRAAEKAP